MFVRLVELALGLILLWHLITQVIVPAVRGTKLFPMFEKEAKLRSDLEGAKQAVEEKKLEQEIKTIKEKEGV